MTTSVTHKFEQQARRLGELLPSGPRLVIIGSTSFWHEQSEETCIEIGRILAAMPELVLITGGVEGVGEATARSFHEACITAGQSPRVHHVLPEGEPAWDYGQTHFAGADMAERREVLARLAEVYLAVEGGPGTVHEARVATARKAIVIPVGRSGGHAAVLYAQVERPALIDEPTWLTLGARAATPREAAEAAVRAVRACLS